MTFASPRTWQFASRVIANRKEIDSIDKIRLAGVVGEGASVEFVTFASIYQSLPTIEQILADPKYGWKVPTEPSEQFAITTMLSHNIDEANINKIIPAIERLPLDFQVITFKDIYKRTPHLKQHKLIRRWISANASSIF